MPYVLYGLSISSPCAGEPEQRKVATFSHEFLAKQYADCSETMTSKRQNHRSSRKYYKWSLLRNYDGHCIYWEENDEVPHNPEPDLYKLIPEDVNTKNEKTDIMGKLCSKCHKGYYKETGINDDGEGNLHCDKCNYEAKRWTKS